METNFLLTSEVKTLGSVELLTGNEAIIQLLNDEFLISWDALYQSCPWSTVFQSKEFVLTWYQTYQNQCLPIVLKTQNNGTVTGILTLAKLSNSLTITGAGGHSAEYHTWLSSPHHSDEFIQEAAALIGQRFPNCVLEFKFSPANTPFDWVKNNRQWRYKRIIREHDQPLVAIDEEHFLKKLNAKTIKEKIRRLKRQGDLQLERITDRKTFAEAIDELLLQFDFRKGALYNNFPSQEDPLFRSLLLNLFEKKVLHVTVLKLNEQIIAGMINTEGKNWVFLKGINTHAPFYAKQSPGLLHFLMLGKLLADEKVEVFDLTPGGDYYKDGLATRRATVYQLWLVNNMRSYIKISLSEWINKLVRDTVTRSGTDPRVFLRKSRKAKETLLFFKGKGVLWAIKRLVSAKKSEEPPVVWAIKPNQKYPQPINRNNLKDLLGFDQNGSEITKWAFLEDAMKRLEFGEQAYTMAKNGKLLACVWLKATTEKHPDLPEEAVVFENLYYHKDFKENFRPFLSASAAKAVQEKNAAAAFAVLAPTNKELLRLLEKSKD